MTNQRIQNAMRLLKNSDFDRTNQWDKPLVGWQETDDGFGLFNPMGFAMLRVVVQLAKEGELQDAYDQIIIIENPGSIVIAINDKQEVCMIKNFRFTAERLPVKNPSAYIAELATQNKWQELVATLGNWQWELPRGIPPIQNESSLKELALKAAKLEGLSEAGITIQNARLIGKINANPTFFLHSQYVVQAQVAHAGENMPENLEIIGERQFFPISEVRDITEDGLSLAALQKAGLK